MTTARLGEGTDGPLLAVYLRDASERGERERELHADARRRSAVLDLGQLALEGMSLDQLLAAVRGARGRGARGRPLRGLGAGRGGRALTLRASSAEVVDQPERIPLSDHQPARLHAAARPGSRGRGGLPARGPLPPGRAGRRGRRCRARSPCGSPGGEPRLRRPRRASTVAAPLRAVRHLPGRVARAAARRGDRARHASASSLAEAESRLRTLIERLPSITYRAGLGAPGDLGIRLAAGRGDLRLITARSASPTSSGGRS